MVDRIRLVVCQIECHPAFYRDRLAYLEEPFMPLSYESSISYLGAIGVPITEIQEKCKKQYIDWQKNRLKSIFSHPMLNGDVPTIVIFPEGSIPINCLEILYNFAKEKNINIVAGSHTILDTVDGKLIYSNLGKEKDLSKRHSINRDVSFIFAGGKIHHQKKQGISPYDRTETDNLGKNKITLHPIPISIEKHDIRIVNLVCADALQLPNVKGDYDIVTIISYDPDPSHFDSYTKTQVENGKVVMYCNDGRYGGSRIEFPRDNRPTTWFYEKPLEGKLPKGDALLIVDVPINERATQVGVSNPKAQYDLKTIAAIDYEDSFNEYHNITKRLVEIKEIESNEARNQQLKILIKDNPCTPLHKNKLEYLQELTRTGIDSDSIWDTYGHDHVLKLTALSDVENTFVQFCHENLIPFLIESDLEGDNFNLLQKYLRECKKRIIKQNDIATQSSNIKQSEEGYIDREDEIKKILDFFDSKNELLSEIIGLAQIGKTAIIKKTLSRTALKKIINIQLTKTSSAEYILTEIKGKTNDTCVLPENGKDESDIELILSQWDVICIQNCEYLLEGRQWKSEKIEELITRLHDSVRENGTKILFESVRSLPFQFRDPSILNKITIKGFEGKLRKYGVSIFDRQLRKLNLNPSDIDVSIKEKIARELGGHPLALILCANAIYEEGITAVLDLIKRGKGFYEEIIDSILKVVAISKEDKHILKILSGCRIEVSRDVIASTCDFPATEYISNLIKQCMIEVVSPNTITLPGILRKTFRFNDLDINVKNKLHNHAAIAYSQMARSPNGLRFAIESEYHANLIGKSIKTTSGLIDGNLAAAKKLYEEHNFEKAKAAINPLITDESSIDILRLSSLIDASLGDLDSALKKADKVFSKNSDDNHLFYILGKATLTQSKLNYAERLVQIGRKTGIEKSRVSILEGRVFLRKRDFKNAEYCFNQALDSHRNEPWAYYFLGKTYFRIGNIEKAIDILYDGDEYLSKNTRIRTAARNAIKTQLGILYVLNGDLDAASRVLEPLIEEDPNSPEVLYAYWLLTVMKEGVDKAEEAFDIFKNASPKRWLKGNYHLYYGLFLKALDDIEKANEQFSYAYKYDNCNVYIMTQYTESLYSLAMKAKMNNNMELARSYAFKCARIVRRLFEFDLENANAEILQVDLYYEFDIQITKIK